MAKFLPMVHGTPLACDPTMASPLHANGEPRPRAEVVDGVAIAEREADLHHEIKDPLNQQSVGEAAEAGGIPASRLAVARCCETCSVSPHQGRATQFRIRDVKGGPDPADDKRGTRRHRRETAFGAVLV